MTSKRFDNELTERLYAAFLAARKNKLNTVNEYKFEMNYPENLHQLKKDILNRTYRPSRGIAFITDKPVIREIFAAPFRDRIVHHYLIGYVNDWWDRHFIYDSYSCRKGKGTDFGIRRSYHHLRAASHNFTIPTFIIKFDIQGYFTSLPRNRIYDRAIWGLDSQFLHENCSSYERELHSVLQFLWQQIIFDEPTENVLIRGDASLWEKLPHNKSLFYQKPGTGIVIGNLTSQVISNIYLDQLDRFITQTLGYRHYGRYVDDFFIVLPADQLADFDQHSLPQIKNFVTGLGLTLHPRKCTRQPIENGMEFLGARIYPHRIIPSQRIIKNYRRDIQLAASGELDLDSIISYHGRMCHFDARHLEQELWDSVGWDLSPIPNHNSRWFTDPKDLLS